jgi:hypothetical protein
MKLQWFTRTTSPSKKKAVDELSLLSDTDSDLEHSDHDSEAEDEDDIPEKRELARLKQEALLADPFANDANEKKSKREDSVEGEMGGATSGRWMCVDEDIIVEEGRAGPSKPKLAGRRTSSSSSSTSSSTLAAASTSLTSKRPSPSFANHEIYSAAAAELDLTGDSSPAQKKQRKSKGGGRVKSEEEDASGERRETAQDRKECPVCLKSFQASLAAMEGHVVQCLKSGLSSFSFFPVYPALTLLRFSQHRSCPPSRRAKRAPPRRRRRFSGRRVRRRQGRVGGRGEIAFCSFISTLVSPVACRYTVAVIALSRSANIVDGAKRKGRK